MDLNVITPGTPLYGVNQLVCFRESALNGYIEQHRINHVEFNGDIGSWEYTFIFNKSKPNTQTVGDAVDLKTQPVIKILESDLMLYNDAIVIVKNFFISQLDKINSIIGTTLSPIIQISGNGIAITNGDDTANVSDFTDYGNVKVGDQVTNTYYILNKGTANLFLTGVQAVQPIGDPDFVISAPPTDIMLPPNVQYPFSIRFSPISIGRKTTVIIIQSNDPSNLCFAFLIEGVGI